MKTKQNMFGVKYIADLHIDREICNFVILNMHNFNMDKPSAKISNLQRL